MLLSPTEVDARSLEHNLRTDKVNRNGWLFPSPQHQNRANPLVALSRTINERLTDRRIFAGLGGRVREEGARSVA